MKHKGQNLRIPGPVPCPVEVLEAQARPIINHRGPEFKELILSVTEKLKRVFQTRNDIFIFTASGTGAMEAAIVNTLSPGDKVLAIVTGAFGRRFADIARAYGVIPIHLDFQWGKPVDPEAVRRHLEADPSIKAVLVAHNETSTGVTNDLESISRIVKGEFGKLLIVDAISSLGSIPLPADEWRCDVIATGTQKGMLTPPGLSFISFSQEAWEAYRQSTLPKFYFDVGAYKASLEKGQTPYTPALTLYYALDRSLEMILSQGLDNHFQYHKKTASEVRRRIQCLGLEILADENCASDTVTAVKIPQGIEGSALTSILRTKFGVVVAGGQGDLTGKIIRIGHMGKVPAEDIDDALKALESALVEAGYKVPNSKGR